MKDKKWLVIKHEYVEGGPVTIESISRRHAVPAMEIARKVKQEGWKGMRLSAASARVAREGAELEDAREGALASLALFWGMVRDPSASLPALRDAADAARDASSRVCTSAELLARAMRRLSEIEHDQPRRRRVRRIAAVTLALAAACGVYQVSDVGPEAPTTVDATGSHGPAWSTGEIVLTGPEALPPAPPAPVRRQRYRAPVARTSAASAPVATKPHVLPSPKRVARRPGPPGLQACGDCG